VREVTHDDVQDTIKNPPVRLSVEKVSGELLRLEHPGKLPFREAGALQSLPSYLAPVSRGTRIERDGRKVDLRECDPQRDVDERVAEPE
jgi:hypothetical protein